MFGTVNPSHACGAGPSRSRGHGRPRRPNFYALVSLSGNNADRHFWTLLQAIYCFCYSERVSVILNILLVIQSALSVILSDFPVILSDFPVILSDFPVILSDFPVILSGSEESGTHLYTRR